MQNKRPEDLTSVNERERELLTVQSWVATPNGESHVLLAPERETDPRVTVRA
jgi:hypothetical protein